MASVERLVTTASDMDVSGLSAIAYYLRLYAVELILGESQRPKGQTEVATELLNQVEQYKGSVDAAKDQDPGSYTLLHEQEKSKTYVLNFAMSLYNEKLLQLQKGPWDQPLRRGLWCCLDLFNCVAKLWDMEDVLRERIKYCKVYLRKIAKEKPPEVVALEASEVSLSESPEDLKPAVVAGVENPAQTEGPRELDYGDFIEDTETADDEIDEMLNQLKIGDGAPGEDVPQFVDEPDTPAPEVALAPVVAPAPAVRAAATEIDFQTIMDRSVAFEQVQRRARYAISALNYEDIATARLELTSALSLLEKIE